MGGHACRLPVGKFSDHYLRIIDYCFSAMLHVLLFICGCVRLLPVKNSLSLLRYPGSVEL